MLGLGGLLAAAAHISCSHGRGWKLLSSHGEMMKDEDLALVAGRTAGDVEGGGGARTGRRKNMRQQHAFTCNSRHPPSPCPPPWGLASSSPSLAVEQPSEWLPFLSLLRRLAARKRKALPYFPWRAAADQKRAETVGHRFGDLQPTISSRLTQRCPPAASRQT